VTAVSESAFVSRPPSPSRVSGLVMVALVAWLGAASPAPAAESDLTAVVVKDRVAAGLPAIGANPAVRAAAGALLGGGNA
jgi:hypothetical protein